MIIMSILHNFGKKEKKKLKVVRLQQVAKLVGIFELHSNLEADVAPNSLVEIFRIYLGLPIEKVKFV